MVSCCANPACRIEFKLLNGGDLYALERRSADTEFFWLCSACVPMVALRLDAMGGVSARLRSDALRPQPPHSDSLLRLVSRFSMDRTPWHRANRVQGRRFQSEPAQSALHSAQPHKPSNYLDTL